MPNQSLCSVIIVTHNSEPFLQKAIDSLQKQTLSPQQLIIVDSGSSNLSYLNSFSKYKILRYKNDIGFCKANNIGYQNLLPNTQYVLLLNPDAFLDPTFLEKATHFMDQNTTYGALGGLLLSSKSKEPITDSSGVFQKWYGSWFDRAQNLPLWLTSLVPEEVPALTGACLFLRKKALDSVANEKNEFFDNSFFMYKEDVDLSLKLQKKGWKNFFNPSCVGYHARGWKRKNMPKSLRLLSAKNEIKVNFRNHFWSKSMISSLKYILVKLFNI